MILTGSVISAQEIIDPNRPGTELSTEKGFITINEINFGFGLGLHQVPYSRSFIGFTTVNGYQFNKSIMAAGGTGLLFYNGGLLVPLFLDFRYRFYINQYTPYVFADGGVLLDFSHLNSTKLFINPGIGIRYAFSRNWAANLGTGLLVQYGEFRDSFINFKIGATYKF
jgi:hypothetical protein